MVNGCIPAQQLLPFKDNHAGQLHRIPCTLTVSTHTPPRTPALIKTPQTLLDTCSYVCIHVPLTCTEADKSHAHVLHHTWHQQRYLHALASSHTPIYTSSCTYEIPSCTNPHRATHISTQHRHQPHFPKRSRSGQGRCLGKGVRVLMRERTCEPT